MSDYLRDGALDRLRAAYDRDAMTALLTETLQGLHPAARRYVDGIIGILYPGSEAAPAAPLAPVDRERCLVALEAARGGRLTVAVHVYLGLMEGLDPEEIAHVLLLAGVYAGVDVFAGGIRLLVRVLATLEEVAARESPDGAAAFAALRATFPE